MAIVEKHQIIIVNHIGLCELLSIKAAFDTKPSQYRWPLLCIVVPITASTFKRGGTMNWKLLRHIKPCNARRAL
jgi:hypothetical protein